ncbi:MAG: ABC transporter ATP-binding protein, partial [Alphaproteobacteria bacterium]|nr:ABC transporter ATP-binding protein [Alphaproteobacteria bacterium]
MNILEIKNLHVGFHPQDYLQAKEKIPLTAADNVGLTLQAGKTHALVGESGSGKSVTALSILRLLPTPAAFHNKGEVLFRDKNTSQDLMTDLMKMPIKKLQALRGNEISMIFQEPLSSLNPLHQIGKQICEAIRLHQPLSMAAARTQAVTLLERCGLRDGAQRLQSFPHQLSGGQRQRVMIAMALANRPKLLIADEPTTALDVTIQKQILDLLKELQQETDMAILLITHDLGVVRRIADSVSVMKNGKIVESGAVQEVLEQPKYAYTKALLAAEPETSPVKVADNKDILVVKNMRVHFKGATSHKWGIGKRHIIKAVDDVSFTLKQGQTLGVVGESGSGKTTLGRAILGLQAVQNFGRRQEGGQVLFEGTDIIRAPKKQRRAMRRHMQIIFQDPFGSLSPRMSAQDIIAEGLAIYEPQLSVVERNARVQKIMNEVELDPASALRYPHEFSGGQRQRIAIARALILEPRFLVLDEPTSALDRSVQAQIVSLLRRLQVEKGLTYLFISHDLKVVRALAHN